MHTHSILIALGIFLLGNGREITQSTEPQTQPYFTCTSSRDLVIPVIVDGRPLCFLVDTGAQMTVVNLSSLSLIPPHMGQCTINGAFGGKSSSCYLSILDQFEVGGITRRNVVVHITPLATENIGRDVDGILGIDFLRNYRVEFDNENFELFDREIK